MSSLALHTHTHGNRLATQAWDNSYDLAIGQLGQTEVDATGVSTVTARFRGYGRVLSYRASSSVTLLAASGTSAM